MSYRIIYHGSNLIVDKPVYRHPLMKAHNDYGYGFYCTQSLDMAKEWANRISVGGYANKYLFDDRGLDILDLTDKSKYSVLNWIAILLHNREISIVDRVEYAEELEFIEQYYIDISKYDVVIGFRADDAYFKFPLMFIRNVLSIERLEEIYNLGQLGKQFVLISERSFERIKFTEAIPSEAIYKERYLSRLDAADNAYKELELQERKNKGTRIRDLIEAKND